MFISKIKHFISSKIKVFFYLKNIFRTKNQVLIDDVKKYTDCYETIQTLLRFHKPIVLCDIGSYNGTWGYTLSVLDSELKSVVCFEPRSEPFAVLKKRYFFGIKKKNYAFGLGNKKSIKYIKGGTPSASFFDEKDQQSFFPDSLNFEKEKAYIYRLDDIYKKDKLPYPDTIKIDVQGYELFVLQGGKNVLSHARYLVIELSFREFYKGQPPLSDILKFLEKNHYEFIDFGHQLRSRKPGDYDLVQIDAIFRNKKNTI